MRQSFLLSKMTDSNVRRTKTPARRKYLRLAAIALPVAVTLPAAYFVLDRPAPDDIETAIKEAGFDPLVPPNRLRGPGALYEVEDGFYRKVCDVDPALLDGKLKSSPAPDRHRESLEKAGFALDAKFVDALNAELSGARLTSIEYTLAHVTISEIDYSHLFEIEDNLLSKKNCDKAVQRLLKANRKVCPGYAALSATTSYKVHIQSKVNSGAEDKVPVINAVQQAIEQRANSELRVQSEDELTGDNLFYGIQLSHYCITPDDASEPSILPQAAAQGAPGQAARL